MVGVVMFPNYLNVKYVTYNDEKGFLETRHHGIGGSDAAAVLGHSPYKTKVELWEQKTNPPTFEQLNSDVIQFGNNAEPVLIRLFELQTGLKVDDTKGICLIHPEYDFIRVNLDGFIQEENAVLEIKTVNRDFKPWYEGNLPQNYYIQLLHEMLVSGADRAYLYALLNTPYLDESKGKLYQYLVERSEVEAEIEFLKNEEIAFWRDNVEPKKRPLSIITL
jgi:putative phage-type endonuclease